MKAVQLGDLQIGSTWWSLNMLFQFYFYKLVHFIEVCTKLG